jgi:hypothetical protein
VQSVLHPVNHTRSCSWMTAVSPITATAKVVLIAIRCPVHQHPPNLFVASSMLGAREGRWDLLIPSRQVHLSVISGMSAFGSNLQPGRIFFFFFLGGERGSRVLGDFVTFVGFINRGMG